LYSLSYEPFYKDSSNLKSTANSALLAAYNLDYSLSSSLIKLPTTPIKSINYNVDAKNVFSVNSDKTVYQDSYNSFLFAYYTTTFTKAPSSYTYLKTSNEPFSFI
jgi:hypothetical protein